MDSLVDLDVQGLSCSVKDISCWPSYGGDLFIVLKVCEGPASLIG